MSYASTTSLGSARHNQLDCNFCCGKAHADEGGNLEVANGRKGDAAQGDSHQNHHN